MSLGAGLYQIRFWITRISPLIWRRFLVNSQSTTIADLHHLIQIAMHGEHVKTGGLFLVA